MRFMINIITAIGVISTLEAVRWTLGDHAAHIAGGVLGGSCVGWWLNEWTKP